ncbi:unnamed protein product, partial [Rotaria sp. Silwood2]
LTIALIDTFSNKNEKVYENVAQSIVDTSKKLPESHGAAILDVIQRILNYHQEEEGEIPFNSDTFQLLTRVAVNELTIPKELIPLWQQVASDVLIKIGKYDNFKYE